jgi:hypothetical protein
MITAPRRKLTAQEAKAQSQNGAVELRLRIAFDGGKSIEWVHVRMARGLLPSVGLQLVTHSSKK